MEKDRAILLDSCIISNLISKQTDLATKTATYLDNLTATNHALYIEVLHSSRHTKTNHP